MTVSLFVAFFATTVSLVVLWANPRRKVNQAVFFFSIICASWLVMVHLRIRGADPLFWVRANAALATFLPWSLAILGLSLATPSASRGTLFRRASPWLLLGVALSLLTFAESFIHLGPKGEERGFAYAIYTAGLALGFLTVVLQAGIDLRKQTGIRRLEIQLFVFNFGLGGTLSHLLISTGNFLQIYAIREASLFVILAAYSMAAWSLAYYRIFELRQLVASIAHGLFAIVLLGGALAATWLLLGQHVPPVARLLLSSAAGGAVALMADRPVRRALSLDRDRTHEKDRRAIINVAMSEPQTEALMEKFEHLIRRQFNAPCHVMPDDGTQTYVARELRFERRRDASAALFFLGWATPETLQRRRATRAGNDLADFMARESLGAMVVAPRGSASPSLVLALGVRSNERPFTYPEIERLGKMAELMDNILTRSRLTSQAALRVRVEHLAIMSRGLAHDLKNLLTPVSSFLVHTDGRYTGDSVEAEVHAAALRSVRIMSDYVREAQFFADRLAPRFERTSLRRVLEGAREALRARAAARQVTLCVGPLDEISFVADVVLIQRLLGNLLANAIDASSPGAEVKLAGAQDGDRVHIEVMDSGCGIPGEHLGRIFEPYFTTKDVGDEVRGFGLGLTICQKIAALHHATLTVRSEVGRGSTFTVDLPQNPEVTAREETFLPASQRAAPRLSVAG